jgi:hypothetical protein
MKDKKPKNTRRMVAAFLSGLVLLVLCAGCISNGPANPAPQNAIAREQSAIIAAANNCTDTNVTITDGVGTFHYTSSENCVFTKTLVRLNTSEMQEMKTMLEGKNMTCWYTKGNFDPRLVTSLVGGIEHCTGDLKDDISGLIIFS